MSENNELRNDQLNRELDDTELELVIGGVSSMGAFQGMTDEEVKMALGPMGATTLSASGKYKLF